MSVQDVIDARLLPGWREGDQHIAALHVTLAPGWKTYWRAPGDAGIPTHFDLTDTPNLTGHRTHWPVPKVFWQNGMRSIGYQDTVTLPLILDLRDPGQDLQLNGTVTLGICKDICIPVHLRLSGILPAKGQADKVIQSALKDRPLSQAEARVGIVTCKVEAISDGMRLTLRAPMPRAIPDTQVAVEASDPGVWVSEPDIVWEGRDIVATTDLVPANAQPFALDRSGLRITLLTPDQAVDLRGCMSR